MTSTKWALRKFATPNESQGALVGTWKRFCELETKALLLWWLFASGTRSISSRYSCTLENCSLVAVWFSGISHVMYILGLRDQAVGISESKGTFRGSSPPIVNSGSIAASSLRRIGMSLRVKRREGGRKLGRWNVEVRIRGTGTGWSAITWKSEIPDTLASAAKLVELDVMMPIKENWRWIIIRNKNGGLGIVGGYQIKTALEPVVAGYIRLVHNQSPANENYWYSLAVHAFFSDMTLAAEPAVWWSAGFTMQKMTKIYEITSITCHTSLQYCEAFRHELLWLVWHLSTMKLIWNRVASLLLNDVMIFWFLYYFLHSRYTCTCDHAT